MAFNQTYQQVGNVYNIDGNLILSSASTRDDLIEQLRRIQHELDAFVSLPKTTRLQVAGSLADAASAAKTPSADKKSVAATIENAGKVLQSTTGVAENAVKLANTLFTMAKWVAAFL
jgi:hypothetical protein